MIDGRYRVLPHQHFGRHIDTQVTGARPHVTVGELKPGPREGVCKLVGVGEKATRDFFIGWVHTHRQVGGQHGRREALGRVMRVGDGAGTGAAAGYPLLRACRALGQLPFKAKQVLEVLVGPLGWLAGPGDFQATGDGVAALAGAKAVLPAEALVLQASRLRLVRDMA